MKIVNNYPPNYARLKELFPIEGKPIFITIGDTLYNPTGMTIPDHCLAHEEVHSEQHLKYPDGVDAFVERYISDPEFRLESEIEAYRAQYRFFCYKVRFPIVQMRFLQKIAQDLSGELYGNCISYVDAIKALI